MGEPKSKIINDSVHGHMEIHPLCVSIMDTVQFQRLRQIKQLGSGYYVYPGASHNRFEHSIGVSHLAGKLIRTLKERQSYLPITDKDILCLEIAGLCHDLGHGPFSHMFDGIFIPLIDRKSKWKHEDASLKMFDHLITENKLSENFIEHGLTEDDITFIKELINGPQGENKTYEGRPEPEKRFLYEIVANKRNGIDVDKWDYFARDCYMLGFSNSFDYTRLMKFVKVFKVNGENQICLRNKEVETLCDMIHTRNNIHRRACQHKVTQIIDIMIADAFELANDHYLIAGTDGRKFKMSDAIDDMAAYTRMTDNILYELLNTSDDELKQSRDIITRVLERKFYTCIGEVNLDQQHEPPSKDEMNRQLEEIIEHEGLDSSQFGIHEYSIGTQNPIDSICFYNKDNELDVNVKNELAYLLPGRMVKKDIFVYCKSLDKKYGDSARECVNTWCDVMRKGESENYFSQTQRRKRRNIKS